MTDTLSPGTRIGPFEIEALIGEGGMGRVYRARDPRLGRSVAIKTLSRAGATDADRIRRFQAEARAAGALDHPNLLVIYDAGHERDLSYIVSELLEGVTIRARLRAGRLPERQAVDYGMQIARGLAAAHARGIVHRDLKPDNLFLTRDGRIKILDFGVAKLTHPADTDAAATTTDGATHAGMVVGTPGYMAPEQVRADPVDHRADIFALGVVLHEMLSGTCPFQRDTVPETLTAILHDDAPALPAGTRPGVAGIVERCLAKRPEDRFHSAHDLGVALELLVATTSTDTHPAGTSAAPVLGRRRLLVSGAASAALLASGLATGTWFERARRPATPPSLRRLTFRRGLIRSARVAPDGQTVLYGALWDGDVCRVHSVRLESPESRPLDLPDANLLAISRSGDLALALGSHQTGVFTYGTLARVPMAGGAPREWVEDVKFADWSPDGSELAIVRVVDGRDRLEYPVGTVLVAPALGGLTGLNFPRVSPDGSLVAFVQCHAPGSLVGRVAVVDRTGTVTPLSGDYLNIHGLAWRGRDILYTAADERPLFRALCAVSPGGTPRTITRMPGNATLWDALPDGRLLIAHTDDRAVMIARAPGETVDRDLSWLDASWAADISRDGRLVLFTETGQGGGPPSAVYIRGTDGSPAVLLTTGAAYALSPDTRWAVCPVSASPGEPASDLMIVPTGAGEPRRVPGQGLVFLNARWLPDGTRIVVLAAAPGRRPRLHLLDLAADRFTPFTPEGVDFFWALSPDGSAVALSGPAAAIELYPIDGTAPRRVPGLTGGEIPAGWIHDGLLVRYSLASGAPLGEITRVDLRTGRQVHWDNILPRDRAGIMVLVSYCVTPDGRSQAYTWHRAPSNLYVAEGFA